REELKRLLTDAQVFVQKCRPAWSDRWWASLFPEAKYVGYKDDEGVLQYVKDGSWSVNHLGEYESEEELVVLYPAQPGKRSEIRLKLEK
ncbi:MAG TPA: hypothetical protein VED18_06020, partial [Candidatus Sulfotelmatobacter sp.]|nr:hypothetical protein [Candidatus Sulfotelmatobacter sp.]